MSSERILGKEILIQHNLQPFELVLWMARGLKATNKFGEPTERTAKALVHVDKYLLRQAMNWPQEEWNSLGSREDYLSSVPDRYQRNGHLVDKELFFDDLLEFIFIREDVEKFLGKPQTANLSDNSPQAVDVPVNGDGKQLNSNSKNVSVSEQYVTYMDILYQENPEKWQDVKAYYASHVENWTNMKIARLLGKTVRTVTRRIEAGEQYAVHDPAGPKLPPLPRPASRKKKYRG
ncbi:MAG: hypothetical protein HQK81_07500 [Desulfovibrionaceae bacterium]|nr:hypothetical protein [Desulfovibrionaceae bacterium]MBF0513895.1 hypothetical protein [Desulfovibrionaceae bacterium]